MKTSLCDPTPRPWIFSTHLQGHVTESSSLHLWAVGETRQNRCIGPHARLPCPGVAGVFFSHPLIHNHKPGDVSHPPGLQAQLEGSLSFALWDPQPDAGVPIQSPFSHGPPCRPFCHGVASGGFFCLPRVPLHAGLCFHVPPEGGVLQAAADLSRPWPF